MRALVTGAAGFIGSRLAAALIESGNEVHGIDRFSDYYDVPRKRGNIAALFPSPAFTFSELDLCALSPDDLPDKLDVVFHLAAQPGVRGSWGNGFSLYVQDNILATQRLLECVATLPKPPRFIYSSSSSVYGAAESYPSSTAALARPQSPYGVSKLAGECLVGAYSLGRNVPAVSLRYFTVYGPGQRPDMAISKIIEAGLTGCPFPMLGDGSQTRDFTYVDDVVRANLLAAIMPSPRGHEVFNVSGGSEIGLADLIALIEELIEKPIELSRLPTMAGDPPRTCGDTTATRTRLGWEPRIDLRQGVGQQLEWRLRIAARDDPLVV